MGVELEWKHAKTLRINISFSNFFSAASNFFKTAAQNPKTAAQRSNSLQQFHESSFGNWSRAIPFQFFRRVDVLRKAASRVNSLKPAGRVCLKTGVLNGRFQAGFGLLGCPIVLFKHIIISSYSFIKHTHPHSWKIIFVHLLEKSNLSVRSDNNTGFSLLKVLQTTTI